jgi:hypothetical protein
MTILAFRCGGCGCVIGIAAWQRNGKVRCGSCGQTLKIPAEAPQLIVPDSIVQTSSPASPRVTGQAGEISGPIPGSAQPATTQELLLPVSETPESGLTAGPTESPANAVGAGTPSGPEPDAWQQWNRLTGNYAGTRALPDAQAGSDVAAEPASATVGMETWAETSLPGSLQETRRPRPIAPEAPRRIPFSFWLLAVLIPTTVTFLALSIILFRLWLDERDKKARHPLEDLPETIEATSDVGGRPRFVINPIQQPPEASAVSLQETKRYDGIEVTPLRVRLERVTYARTQDGRTAVSHPDLMLVLYLRIRNVSDHVFQPFDPIFNVAWREGRAVYTFLTIGEERFYGPVQDAALERIAGQDFSEIWPAPKNADEGSDMPTARQVLETKVLAYQSPSKRRVREALEGLPPDTTLRWHVQLRKGRQDRIIKQKPQRLWLTTVVPVEFRVSQIERGDPPANGQP